MRKLLIQALALLLLANCAPLPFEAPPEVAVTPNLSAGQLARLSWPDAGQRYRVRQTVLFELRGARVPMTGLMDLDTSRGEIRLVAVNDLGVKFFDLQLDREGETLHYLLPELARFPDFGKVVASAVRRIFLAPRPDGDEALHSSATRYRLEGREDGDKTIFEFGGPGPQLLAIEVEGSQKAWRVDYYEYRDHGVMAPRGIILNDHRAGYRLTLWLDEVSFREP